MPDMVNRTFASQSVDTLELQVKIVLGLLIGVQIVLRSADRTSLTELIVNKEAAIALT